MAPRPLHVPSGLAAGAVLVAHPHPASAFQTPIIFPLLWMAKRLTRHRHIGAPILPPLMPSFMALQQRLVAIKDAKKTDADRMIDWLENKEGTLSKVKVDENAEGLRGLYAKKDIRSGEILVEIPYDAALLVGDTLDATIFDDFGGVPGSETWDAEEMDDVYQGLAFLQQFNTEGEHAPYVDSLPPKPSSDEAGLTPDFWPEESIRGLEVPSLVQRTLDRKQMVDAIATKNNVEEDDLRWATWMVRSRRFTTWNMVDDPNAEGGGPFGVGKQKIEQIQGFLLPLIDMANHAHDPNADLKISVNRWTREFDDTSTFALRALKPIKKGGEVTIAYGDGDRTSLDFLDKYGFFLEGNEADDGIDWDELQPEFTTSLEADRAELATMEPGTGEDKHPVLSKTTDKLKTIVSKIQDYEPRFASTLDGLALVGAGVRKKIAIQIYGVAMYGSPTLLDAAARSSSSDALRNAARTFDAESPRTTFVLEMILSADAATIAEAIADSVKVRYDGLPADVLYLESLIAEGVKARGEPSTKGCMLQFDCTEEGVGVTVDGRAQGTAKFGGLGGALVDVFLDENAVSPSLVESCLESGRSHGEQVNSNAAVGSSEERTGSASRRTMLSLRVLMKRLSNWQMPSPTTPTTVDGPPVNGGELEQQEEVINPEVTIVEPPELTATTSGASVEAETGMAESPPPNDSETPSSAGAEVSAADATSADETPPTQTVWNEIDGKPTTTTEDVITFDADEVEARIQELEAEIEAEVARVTSLGIPLDDVSDVGADPVPAALEGEAKPSAEQDEAAAAAAAAIKERCDAVESKMKPLKDKATGVNFDPKLAEGLYLVGVGVRKKAIINVYAVAMYSSPSTLEALSPFPRGKQKQEAQNALRTAARTFDGASSTTSFVLEMTFKADGATIAGAIAEGVKPRYGGPAGDVKQLETLIIDGVKSKGGQATKGTIFRFDCSAEGVKVSVDGNEQGMARFEGIGSAFVDVFMDGNAVSPPLVASCLDTWCGSDL